jgi:hypothetical protein
MKKLFLVFGLFLFFLGLFQGFKYLFDYKFLTQYGQGYVWGSIILCCSGLAMFFLGLRKKNSNS